MHTHALKRVHECDQSRITVRCPTLAWPRHLPAVSAVADGAAVSSHRKMRPRGLRLVCLTLFAKL